MASVEYRVLNVKRSEEDSWEAIGVAYLKNEEVCYFQPVWRGQKIIKEKSLDQLDSSMLELIFSKEFCDEQDFYWVEKRTYSSESNFHPIEFMKEYSKQCNF
jgi:hypothetical protein